MERGRNELCIVDLSISVYIYGSEHRSRIHLILLEKLCHGLHAGLEFIERENAIMVGIELVEHLSQFRHILRLCLQVRDD